MMSLTEATASILLHLIPILAVLLFYPLIRRPLWRRLYVRLSLCFITFWFGYFVLPVLLFGVNAPLEAPFDLTGVYNPWLSALGYYITVFLNLVAIFIRTALFVMPFAFFFAPIMSIIILLLYLRHEKGSFREKLNEISYRYEASPIQKIRDHLSENVWKEEKKMFKQMIVFLPISLYFLTLVLTVFTKEFSQELTQQLPGMSAEVGVFIEDLVAYLASFLAAVYLLYSSKLSFRGRSLGDSIRFSVDRFLVTTGTVLASFSILAFVVQFSQYLIGLGYFVIHYVMMSIIFSLLLPLFEPFGSLVLIKAISAIGRFKPKERLRSIFNRKTLSALVIGLAVACAALLIHILVSAVTSPLVPTDYLMSKGSGYQSYYDLPRIGGTVSFADELLFIRLFMVFSLDDLVELLLISAILFWFARQQTAPVFETVLFAAIFSTIWFLVTGVQVVTSLIPTGVEYYWVTGIPAAMSAPGFYLSASRLGTLPVSGPLLTVGAALFMSLSPTLLLLLLVYLTKYARSSPILSKAVEEENIVEKVYSSLSSMPGLVDLKGSPEDYSFGHSEIEKPRELLGELATDIREDVERLLGKLVDGKLLGFSALVREANLKEKRAYEILRYLVSQKLVRAYQLEVKSVTYNAAPQSLFITTTDGLSMFNYTFGIQKIDPALISGMLTAIISFVKEATKSRQFLRTIEHGDVVLVVEFGKHVFGTIVADHETPDLRIKLRKFIDKYEEKHADILQNFTGRVPDAEKDQKLAESIFGQF
jgi:hypothetical protein